MPQEAEVDRKIPDLGLLQDIIYEWVRTAGADEAFAAIETLKEIYRRDEVWRQSDDLLRKITGCTEDEAPDEDPDVPF